ncbi:MAG: MmcQ/YjbR family DNA-binding protein [Desulfobulbaceae bacterium]|nr:MAG: MmcQ/YjbR family DNA-binding protein [Desulfobulbaceae bacterium]
MNKAHIEDYLAEFSGAESSFPFGPEAMVFKVRGKMFALVSQGETPARVTLKCNPDDGAMLVSQYSSVVPGYYMNKKHWVTISLVNEVSDDLMEALIADSYQLVVSKLPKKERIELQS